MLSYVTSLSQPVPSAENNTIEGEGESRRLFSPP